MIASTFGFIFVLIFFFRIDSSVAEKELPKLKGIVKTIYGKYDVIDCVDIYQQPAFDHPLLKDHKIQMMPPQNVSEEYFFYKAWHEMDECPEGTVPIKRFEEVNEALLKKMKGGPIYINASKVDDVREHEYVTARVDDGTYYGTKFAATLWNPHVEPNEMSLAQTWITAGPNDALNSIEVGWMVYPGLYNDYRTRLFVYWTPDGYRTGCYNHLCPGFVQLSRRIFPGIALTPISQYGSQNYEVLIVVYKAQGNWYLQVDEEIVGYWPANIVPLLRDSASGLEWGGEIVNKRNSGYHTTTQMGSGHFANEKYNKAASIFNLKVNIREGNPNFRRPRAVYPLLVSDENCYSLLRDRYNRNYGDHFFYGGPGYSRNCPW